MEDSKAETLTATPQRYALRAKADGSIIYTFSPEATINNVPQWVIKAPDGTVVYRINKVEKISPVGVSTESYAIRTRDGGDVFFLEKSPLDVYPPIWVLKAKLGGVEIASFRKSYDAGSPKWVITSPEGNIIYLILPLPAPDGQLYFSINSEDKKPIYFLFSTK